MKILIIVDKKDTAIDRLAESVRRNLVQHEIKILPVHPKRNDMDTLIEAQKLMGWADVIDIHYWKSGQVLRTSFPTEFMAKPRVLFHFNPYDAESEENQYYDKVVVGNTEIHNRVPSAYLIPYGIDLSFFAFNEILTDEKVVNMSVNRIEGKKGVLEVAQVCKELGYKFKLVGRVSEPNYMHEVMKAGEGIMEFTENATDERLREIYYQSRIHVCNSVDGFESGTLPVLEAMACGVPVLARKVGHVPDLYDGTNMVVRDGKPDDIEELKAKLRDLMENREWQMTIREKAWHTVRNRDDRRMALEVNKLYYQIFQPELDLISIILPTRDHPENFIEALGGCLQQDYPKVEIVVADSGDLSVEPIVKEGRRQSKIPIKYVRFSHGDNYTLAEARNRAVIEADGKYLVFCDDRIRPEPNALSVFYTYKKPRVWIWGMKDNAMKGFVENFSFVNRQEFINGGMFCERMQWYGGMTQEIRERYGRALGMDFVFLDEAKAFEVGKSHSKRGKRNDILEAKLLIQKMYAK